MGKVIKSLCDAEVTHVFIIGVILPVLGSSYVVFL